MRPFTETPANTQEHARPFARCSLLVILLLSLASVVGADYRPSSESDRGEDEGSILINEFMASNASTLQDEDGDYSDWIELYNAGDASVNIGGYGISDDLDQPFRWIIPDSSLAPGSFMLVFASGKDRHSGEALHTNFSIASDGEPLTLTSPDSVQVDYIPAIESRTDVSYGRQPDGSEQWFFFEDPTPGASNTTPPQGQVLPAPVFSHSAGFYTGDFDLVITTPVTDAVIYYTLDGSDPDATSNSYEGPIRIRSRNGDPNVYSEIPTNPETSPSAFRWEPPEDNVAKATVVRARTVLPGSIDSPISSTTYFVDPAGADRYSMPVISVMGDPRGFFDHDDGIYVPGRTHEENPSWEWYWGTGNYHQRGIEWERPVHFSFFHRGQMELGQDVGARIHGGGSRSLPQKSLRIYARGSYGSPSLSYHFFPEKNIRDFRRIILRNSGQDYSSTMFRDGFLHRLVQHLDLDVQAFRPAIVFLNGEYWGIHNIRERIDKYYFHYNHGADPENIDYMQFNGQVIEGDNAHYLSLLNFIESNDLSLTENFEYVARQIDIDNFMTYQLVQIYIANMDWPYNNMEFWRPRTDQGRWRWIVFDLDSGFGLSTPLDVETLARAAVVDSDDPSNPAWATFLLRNLLKNANFERVFINRYADLMNTAFHPDRVTSMIDSLEQTYEGEMDEHIRRWNRPNSMEAWREQVDHMRSFASQRPEFTRQHVVDFFDLPGTAELVLEISEEGAGSVWVNSIPISSERRGVHSGAFPWSGIYFQGVPIEIRAEAAPGFRFAGWETSDFLEVTDRDSIVIVPTSDVQLKAVFEPVFPPYVLADSPYILSAWSPNEPAGTYPPYMIFEQTSTQDPELQDEMEEPWRLPYNLESRSRIVGLGDEGFAFINTGNPQEDGGGYLGTATLALDASQLSGVTVRWTAGTVRPNEREYAIRMQYRLGTEEPFQDVLDPNGDVVEYRRNEEAGHNQVMGPVTLPPRADGYPYIQIRWKYYYIDTGRSGPRPMLRVDDIAVAGTPAQVPLVSPDPAAIDQGPVVRLEWLEAIGGTSYHLQISESESFGSAIVDTVVSSLDVELPQLSRDRTYYWRVRAENILTVGPWSEVRGFSTLPSRISISQNYPNPFSNETTIVYRLSEPVHVKLEIFDALGRKVSVLTDEEKPAGTHSITWHAGGMGSGVYFYRLVAGETIDSKKLVVVR